MWPYNDAEAGWLSPPAFANDNDPQRRVAPRKVFALPPPPPARKPERKT